MLCHCVYWYGIGNPNRILKQQVLIIAKQALSLKQVMSNKIVIIMIIENNILYLS